MPSAAKPFWTNRSVLSFAGDRDPMEAIVEQARAVALEAMEGGWTGPPFNPFDLAERLGVRVVAHEDLSDARLTADESGVPHLEYNPTRPRGRLRFSIAHELAHTFFPDFKEAARYRSGPRAAPDAWQLELLCDVAAAELLMPVGSFAQLEEAPLQIERLMELRREHEVSMEALLLRVVKLTPRAVAVIAASRIDGDDPSSPLRIDYVVPSRIGWTAGARRGATIAPESPLGYCTAIGYTAKGDIDLGEGPVRVECAGIPPYPGERLPRVVALTLPREPLGAAPPDIEDVYGDATEPRGTGLRIVAHVVNDRTANWGGVFARALKEAYPETQRDFRQWVTESRSHLRLGRVRFCEVRDDLVVATMVAQRGFGISDMPRVRYGALRQCLEQVAELAGDRGANVHMPRIGTGGGGGDWRVIRELIRDSIVRRGIPVTVYSPPETKPQVPAQQMIPLD
jgi:O-acetyl-ADP-ribose deacetylase (regulator of RNase III)